VFASSLPGEAVSGENHLQSYQTIYAMHVKIAVDAGICESADAFESTESLDPLIKLLQELKRILDGIRMIEEVSWTDRQWSCDD
jgi:hypothetical protein